MLSAMYTVTAEHIRSVCTEFPLVVGQFNVCSCALINLLLVGIADDNISAYTPTGAKHTWETTSRIGLLSGMEHEQKFLVMDELKRPTQDIFVLHGRDHFTLCFRPPSNLDRGDHTSQCLHSGESMSFDLVHWNGLPPGGPRVTILHIDAHRGARPPAPDNFEEGVGIEYKPTPNTIDTVIQANSADKNSRPDQWQSWSYEVALTIDDPSNQSPSRPDHLPPLPIFHLREDDVRGRAWRCRACFEGRYQTMCFGLNDAVDNESSENEVCCRHCGGKRSAVGWTLWMSYDELPQSWKAYVDRQHGPQLTTVLRTKWPACKVEVKNGAKFPSV